MKNKWLVLLLGLAVSMFVGGCGDDDDDNPAGPGAGAELDVIQAAVDAYTDSDTAPTISAQTLFDNLNDGDTSNDPYVLSVRSAEHYAIGHIPTAENIPWREIGDAAKLATLPTDKQIVVYCYTGHTGAVATTALAAMGYDAVNLKFGICGWTKDAAVRATTMWDEATSPDFAVETTANSAGSYELAEPDNTTSTDADEIVRAAVEAYVAATGPVITAQVLFDNLGDGNDANDPVIVSVRSADHYAIGHIPGAINIPWRSIAKTESLQQLPTDKQIVVYCYTGHTGGVATTALQMLGYDAVNLKFGMCAWTQDDAVRVTTGYYLESTAPDFATE